MFQQELAAFGALTHTPSPSIPTNLPMYFKNPITSFPNLSSTYISGSVAQNKGVFAREKLNGQNYFSWSHFVKMILKGHCKFGFLTEEVPRPPPSDSQEVSRKGRIASFGP